jgi:hypothetical protein
MQFLLNILPTGALPATISTAVNYFVSIMYRFNALFPIDTLFQVVAAFVIFEIGVFTFNLMQWTYHQIWGTK